MAKIGIVTVLYNSEKVLDEFFKSLDEQSYRNFTLYIIDNASTDNGLQKAHNLANKASFRCVFFEEKSNWGVAKGNNIGINAALSDGCEYILLSNNDVVLHHKNTLKSMVERMNKTNIDILCPKIYYYDSPNIIWAAGGDFIKHDTATVHFGSRKKDNGEFDEEIDIRYTPTCFVIIKAEIFKIIGLMDERYFVYYDDTDFMYRAWKAKCKIVYSPITSILHNESSSTGMNSPFKLYQATQNQVYFVKKNRTFLILIWLIIYKIALIAFVHSRRFSKELIKAEVRGFLNGLRNTFKFEN